jgi:ketosteroid isomerase-like protein
VTSDDHIEILELMARLGRAFDDDDRESWLAAFAADGVLESSSGTRAEGKAGLASFFASVGHQTFHTTMNPVVHVDGDVAEHTASWVVLVHAEDGVRPLAMGRYHDALVRTAGGWLIARRVSETR